MLRHTSALRLRQSDCSIPAAEKAAVKSSAPESLISMAELLYLSDCAGRTAAGKENCDIKSTL